MSLLPVALALVAAASPVDDPGALGPPAIGRIGVAVNAQGVVRVGPIAALDPETFTIELGDGFGFRLPRARLRGALPDRVRPYGADPSGQPEVWVILDDGAVVTGRLAARRPEVVLVGGPGERRWPAERVVRIVEVPVAARPIDPRPRYAEAPSAFLLRPGEVHLSSSDLVHLTATVGLAPWAALSVGTAVPAFQASDLGGNVQASLRAALPVGEHLRLAGGIHTSTATGGGGTTVFLSATATYAFTGGHLSLHAGPAFPGSTRVAELGDLALALAGSWTVAPRLDVVAEAWAGRDAGVSDGLVLAAARARVARVAADLGFLRGLRSGETLPWLGLTLDGTP